MGRRMWPTSRPFCHSPARLAVLLAFGLFLLGGPVRHAPAQIGGKTAADGPFTLEDAEDLDLSASGVQRDWIESFVFGSDSSLEAVSLGATGLTPASGQSPVGVLRYTMPTAFGFVDHSFGVPMPAVPGASTLDSPGNIDSFTHLTFLAQASTDLTDQTKEVILECYPDSGGVFPTLHWTWSVTPGTAFQPVSVDLHSPSLILNGGSHTVSELLSRTRFLSFYFYGGPEPAPQTLTVHVDDIRLTNVSSISDWALY